MLIEACIRTLVPGAVKLGILHILARRPVSADMPSFMFARTAQYHDLIYSFKNYGEEASKIRAVIRKEHPAAHSILDVACGTAEHAKLLSAEFAVDGIDLEPGFVEIARRKVPTGTFSVADMRRFELRKKYDVVQCLFSSIGYLTQGDCTALGKRRDYRR